MDLYHDAIVAAARRAREPGRLEQPDASVTVDNPLCGDRVTIDVRMSGQRLDAVGQRVRGCLLCEACAVLLAEQSPGEPIGRLAAVEAALRHLLVVSGEWPDGDLAAWRAMAMFAPVHDFKSRHRCVLLPFDALRAAIAQARAAGAPGADA